jgi:hypothetical protein
MRASIRVKPPCRARTKTFRSRVFAFVPAAVHLPHPLSTARRGPWRFTSCLDDRDHAAPDRPRNRSREENGSE